MNTHGYPQNRRISSPKGLPENIQFFKRVARCEVSFVHVRFRFEIAFHSCRIPQEVMHHE